MAEGVQEGLMLGDWDQKFWWVAGRAWLPLDSPINTISGVAQTPRLTRVSQTMCKEVPTECWRSEVLLRIQTGYAEKQNKTRGKDWETRHTQAPKYSTGQRPVCAAYMLQAVNSQMRKKYSFICNPNSVVIWVNGKHYVNSQVGKDIEILKYSNWFPSTLSLFNSIIHSVILVLL